MSRLPFSDLHEAFPTRETVLPLQKEMAGRFTRTEALLGFTAIM